MISPFKKKSVQRISALIIFLAGWQLHGFSQENLTPKRDALLDSIEACDHRGDVARSNQFARLWVEKNRLSASPDSLLYAKALVLLSDGLMDEKASDEVRALLEKALQIQVRSLGPDHGDVGRTTSKMGNFYFAMEDLKNTEIWWEKALKIREKAFGPNHKDVATTLYNLGLLYEITDFRKSELCHTRALEIRRAVLDSTHEDIGNSLQALGNLYANSFGDHLRAEPMYQESLAILIKTLGEVHSYVAYTLNSLGELYQYLGDYQKAEQFTLRSYEILCKTAGPESGETGLLLNNLGAYYQEIGDFKKAEFYHRKAFAIASKGESEGTGKATSLLNLGIVNQSLGNYSLAEKQLWESFAIKGRILGEKHPSTVFIKSQLLKNYTQTKAFAKAERMGLEALSILEKTWGETHPESLNCRNSLGILKWAEGKPNEAANWFRKNNTLNQKAIERVFPHFSEKSREVFLEKASINAAYFQSFCLAQGKKQPMWVGDLYNHRLAYKGLLMNTSARWKKTIKTSGDPSLLKVYEEWEGLRNEIGNLFSSSDTARRQSLDSLVEKADKLEKEISGKLAHKESGKKWKFRTWQEVQKALKPGEAAIEMVRLQKFGMARKGIDTSSVPNKTYLI
ncbi:MAG TPA: tetratricopeptide repeat protein, partial [Catalimonadaceae bacterium]|nr:tetratricopeptide repeat protein [Catalimonadaceae bacterium]